MDLGGVPWFSAFHVFSLFQRKTFKTNPQQILALPGRNPPHQPFFGFQLTGDAENANLSRCRCSLSWGFQISEHILEKKNTSFQMIPNADVLWFVFLVSHVLPVFARLPRLLKSQASNPKGGVGQTMAKRICGLTTTAACGT